MKKILLFSVLLAGCSCHEGQNNPYDIDHVLYDKTVEYQDEVTEYVRFKVGVYYGRNLPYNPTIYWSNYLCGPGSYSVLYRDTCRSYLVLDESAVFVALPAVGNIAATALPEALADAYRNYLRLRYPELKIERGVAESDDEFWFWLQTVKAEITTRTNRRWWL